MIKSEMSFEKKIYTLYPNVVMINVDYENWTCSFI